MSDNRTAGPRRTAQPPSPSRHSRIRYGMRPSSLRPVALHLPGDEALIPLVRRGHRRYSVEIDGTEGSVAEWCEAADIRRATFYDRLARGERGRELLRPPRRPGRPPRMLTALGETKSLTEWSLDSGISKSTIKSRLHALWSPDDAVSIPPGHSGFGPTKPSRDTDSYERRPPPPCPIKTRNAHLGQARPAQCPAEMPERRQ